MDEDPPGCASVTLERENTTSSCALPYSEILFRSKMGFLGAHS